MAGSMNELTLVPTISKPLLLLPSLSSLTSLHFSKGQKITLVVVLAGLGAVGLASHYLRRRRCSIVSARTTKASGGRHESARARRHKSLNIRTPSGDTYSLGGSVSPGFHRSVPRQSSVCGAASDRGSVASSSLPPHVASGPDTTPQQFGVLGMESLGTAVTLFEDALSAYSSQGPGPAMALTTQEEAEFVQSLQAVIEGAYTLQDQCEHLFLHQHSVLFRGVSPDREHPSEAGGVRDSSVASRSRTLASASSLESFVSAQGDIADLRDLEDFDESLYPLYTMALKLHEGEGIPLREVRMEEVGCSTEAEYVCKVHCIRLASQLLFSQQETKDWFSVAGRHIIADLLVRAGKDPKDAITAYDTMLVFLASCDWVVLETELRGRGVVAITFYDVLLDFILLDAFEDLEKPPSSVTAVVQNRWLSNSFKESALSTAVWSVLKAKRRMLRHQDGFLARFYDITEHLSPVLAWGFLGPDQELKEVCTFFKEQIMSLLGDMFSFTTARYTTVEELAADLLQMTHDRFTVISQHLALG